MVRWTGRPGDPPNRLICGPFGEPRANPSAEIVDLTPLSERTPTLQLSEPFANTVPFSLREISRSPSARRRFVHHDLASVLSDSSRPPPPRVRRPPLSVRSRSGCPARVCSSSASPSSMTSWRLRPAQRPERPTRTTARAPSASTTAQIAATGLSYLFTLSQACRRHRGNNGASNGLSPRTMTAWAALPVQVRRSVWVMSYAQTACVPCQITGLG
ncbi:hypothetical protein E1298_15805 [Actinomadura rubrisoli]|uniref:Uncharacterized protein n=1 Tax=Actinomadura rubrisoli TaxID=2530368 RepID=A0A4R5BLT6_9ACTN|nr:hypothetical protein E1298_15805 [Actinomadura rubrisoli]